jgi:hypothetical protein
MKKGDIFNLQGFADGYLKLSRDGRTRLFSTIMPHVKDTQEKITDFKTIYIPTRTARASACIYILLCGKFMDFVGKTRAIRVRINTSRYTRETKGFLVTDFKMRFQHPISHLYILFRIL